MAIQSFFSNDECNVLIESLSLYSQKAVPLMLSENHNKLIQSSIEKIKTISPFTNFSENELNIMFWAVDYFEANSDTVPPCIYKLLLKLKDHCKSM